MDLNTPALEPSTVTGDATGFAPRSADDALNQAWTALGLHAPSSLDWPLAENAEPATALIAAPPAAARPSGARGAADSGTRQAEVRASASTQIPRPPTRTAPQVAGELVDDGQDTMALHTREAMQLFAGRQPSANAQLAPIVGGRRAAAAVRALWYLSGNDNPYAEWALISTTAALESAANAIAEAQSACEQHMERLRSRGLNLRVQSSRRPAQVELGFSSPYGYAIAELVLQFDAYMRVVKTLARKGQLSEDEWRAQVAQVRRHARSAFELVVRFERYLNRPQLRSLCRADLLPTADEAARNRVAAVTQLYGEVPHDVLVGKLRPRHSRRRGRLTDAEVRLLENLTRAAEAPEQHTEAEADSDVELL